MQETGSYRSKLVRVPPDEVNLGASLVRDPALNQAGWCPPRGKPWILFAAPPAPSPLTLTMLIDYGLRKYYRSPLSNSLVLTPFLTAEPTVEIKWSAQSWPARLTESGSHRAR